MAQPGLSVVVVHHRGEQHLRDGLAAISAASAGAVSETILVDNTGKDARGASGLERVLRDFPEVRRVGSGGNTGFAAGCRQGAEAARFPILLFVNDDAAVQEDAPALLRAALEAAPSDVAAVAGRLVDWTGRTNDFSDGFLTFDGHAFQKDVGRPVADAPAGAPGEERLFACGGLMTVRRDLYLETGGFDDDFFAYLEDVDFGWRQWVYGNRIIAEPRAVARHRGGATGEALGLYSRGFLFEKNAFSTAYKNFDDEHFRAYMPAILGAFIGRIAEMLATRNPGASELARDPYRDRGSAPEGAGGGAKIWRKLLGIAAPAEGGSEAELRIGDPLTIAHLRALLWIHRHQDSLARKRAAVQARRRRGDAEIFGRFPLRIVPTYPGDERFDGAYFRELLGRAPGLVRSSLAEIFR